MNKRIPYLIVLVVCFLGFTKISDSWGRWGHRHINRAAIFPLPSPMQSFFYNHIDYITESSVVPDLRRPLLNDKAEGPRHFVDIEDFDMPIESMPKTSLEASAQLDSALLAKAGILPWYIQDLTNKLTRAFKAKNKSDILFLSSELAHYIGDAHMPLHTSSNYNGQLTGQEGIHSLWESVLPPMFGNKFNLKTQTPKYISDITANTWEIIKRSHALVDTVLLADRKVRSRFDSTNMYLRDKVGNLKLRYGKPMYSDAYAQAFQQELGDMIENQLKQSIYQVSCYWFTAWVDAGKPYLGNLDDASLTKRNKKLFKQEFKSWEKGKLMYISK